MGRRVRDEKVQRVALGLLARGECSPGDIAEHFGISRQAVEGWALVAGIRWRELYRARIGGLVRRAMNGPTPPARKARLRAEATKAKVEWDKRHAQEPKAVGD
jgi:hypothetical protein